MKNYIKIFAPVVLAILVGSLTFIFAQTNGGRTEKARPNADGEFRPPPPPGGAGLHPGVLEQLNLTAAQKEQIHAIHFNSRDAAQEYFAKVRAADEQLKAIVESGKFDEEKARQILSAKAAAMTGMEIVRLRADAAIYNLLTDEQKTQLASLKEKRPEFPSAGGFRPKGQ